MNIIRKWDLWCDVCVDANKSLKSRSIFTRARAFVFFSNHLSVCVWLSPAFKIASSLLICMQSSVCLIVCTRARARCCVHSRSSARITRECVHQISHRDASMFIRYTCATSSRHVALELRRIIISEHRINSAQFVRRRRRRRRIDARTAHSHNQQVGPAIGFAAVWRNCNIMNRLRNSYFYSRAICCSKKCDYRCYLKPAVGLLQ